MQRLESSKGYREHGCQVARPWKQTVYKWVNEIDFTVDGPKFYGKQKIWYIGDSLYLQVYAEAGWFFDFSFVKMLR